MPTIQVSYCDNCNKEISNKETILIYRIEFWSNKESNFITKDFLFDNNIALMLCNNPNCIGLYLIKLINKGVNKNGK